jgi:hypothetical protein
MDFLDPIEQRRHIKRLYTTYVLVAIAVLLSVALLLLIAVGYSINRKGEVVQNGLVFVSSRPKAADIFLNDKLASNKTNTRLNIPSGSYTLKLQREGYRNWQTQVLVIGNKVVRYDYPLLFPTTLQPTAIKSYAANPGITTQTPDKRFLLVEQRPGSPTFDVFDLKNPKTAPMSVTVPSSTYTVSTTQSWQAVDWASDKDHLLLKHTYGTKKATEFVLLDRTDPAQTVNLNTRFQETPAEVKFVGGKFDKYYVYLAVSNVLQTATLTETQPPVTLLKDVLAYVPYQTNTVMYVAPSSDKNLVDVHILKGDQTYTLRQLSAQRNYLLDLSSHQGTLYAAIGDASKGQSYLYKDPLAQLTQSTAKAALPMLVMRLQNPTFLNFSAGGQYLVAESGTHFAAYDLQYKRYYTYIQPSPIDAGQKRASWMDGAHLQYVSKGLLRVFDFDGTNAQQLMPARSPGTETYYDNNYQFVYNIAKQTDSKTKKVDYVLTSTSLLTPEDQ